LLPIGGLLPGRGPAVRGLPVSSPGAVALRGTLSAELISATAS
jgi:hypothetical protein